MTHKRGKTLIAAIAAIALAAAGYAALRARPPLSLDYDPAYWPSTSMKTGEWRWCLTPSGINYSLYVPAAMDREDASPTIPLIVVFHGSTQKAIAKDRFGRIFTSTEMQSRLGPNGAAVLAVQSRVEYFSDPHAYARLIENIVMQNPCIDKTRIAGFGFSQGAAFVQELAMYKPSLFRAVASGSSYYAASMPELFRAARVRFWCATSRNDQGIYEQGHVTGKILSAICPNSRYVEYEKRGHFYVEPGDKSGKGKETFTDWLAKALAR